MNVNVPAELVAEAKEKGLPVLWVFGPHGAPPHGMPHLVYADGRAMKFATLEGAAAAISASAKAKARWEETPEQIAARLQASYRHRAHTVRQHREHTIARTVKVVCSARIKGM